jgi:hypothetical protein
MTDEFRFGLFLFLSAPGRLWVWLVGLMLGIEVEADIQ